MYFFTLKIDYNSNDKDRLLKNANWYSADSDPVGPRWSLKVHISSRIWDVPAILVDTSHFWITSLDSPMSPMKWVLRSPAWQRKKQVDTSEVKGLAEYGTALPGQVWDSKLGIPSFLPYLPSAAAMQIHLVWQGGEMGATWIPEWVEESCLAEPSESEDMKKKHTSGVKPLRCQGSVAAANTGSLSWQAPSGS